MFLNNKYSTWYYNIINNSKNRLLTGYKEKHHIIPRCLGGKDTKENLAILTAREHFIVHLLLCKFTIGQAKIKMLYAFHAMCTFKNAGRYNKVNSRLVEKIRSNYKFTEEHKRKISEAHKGKTISKELIEKLRQSSIGNKNCLGKKASLETKLKMGLIQKNMIWVNKDNIETRINKELKNDYINNGYSFGRKQLTRRNQQQLNKVA
jgi:predicted membrane protein